MIYKYVSPRKFLYFMLFCGLLLQRSFNLCFEVVFMRLVISHETHDLQPHCNESSSEIQSKISVTKPEFHWDDDLQKALVYSGSFSGTLTSLASGMFVDKFGPKTLFGFYVFLPAIFTILLPVCSRVHPYVLIANRVIGQLLYKLHLSAIPWFLARWCDFNNQGFHVSIIYSSMFIGNAIFGFSKRIMDDLNPHWPTPFYVTGCIAMVWVYLWQEWIYEDPFNHPYMTNEQMLILASQVPMYFTRSWLEPGWSWPMKKILSSSSVWTLIIAEMGFYHFVYLTTFAVPLFYFTDVLNEHLIDKPVHTAFLFVMSCFAMVAAGVISDWIIASRSFNLTHVTKTYYFIACVIGPCCLIGMVHSDCDVKTAFIYYMFALFCLAIGRPNQLRSCLSMAPNFVGTIGAFTGFFVLLSIILQYNLMFIVVNRMDVNTWKTFMYISASISITCALIFIKYGNVQPTQWNEPKSMKRRMVSTLIVTNRTTVLSRPTLNWEALLKAITRTKIENSNPDAVPGANDGQVGSSKREPRVKYRHFIKTSKGTCNKKRDEIVEQMMVSFRNTTNNCEDQLHPNQTAIAPSFDLI